MAGGRDIEVSSIAFSLCTHLGKAELTLMLLLISSSLSRVVVTQHVSKRTKTKSFYISSPICTSFFWTSTANKIIRSIMLAVFLVNSKRLMWTCSSLSLSPVQTTDWRVFRAGSFGVLLFLPSRQNSRTVTAGPELTAEASAFQFWRIISLLEW